MDQGLESVYIYLNLAFACMLKKEIKHKITDGFPFFL